PTNPAGPPGEPSDKQSGFAAAPADGRTGPAASAGQASAGGAPGGRPDAEGADPGGVPLHPLLRDNAPVTAQRRPTRPPPLPLSRLIGNRDWPIVIECKDDAVLLRITGLRVP